MRVWTIQPPEVLKIIEETGRFVCSKEKSQYYNDENFKGPYEWMVRKMIKNHHMMTPPQDTELPIWGWVVHNGRYAKPSLDDIDLGIPGKKYVCIGLELHDHNILLSNEEWWHCVLNNDFLNIHTGRMYDETEKWYDNLCPFMQNVIKIESWDNIFVHKNDIITRYRYDHTMNKYVQATFWEIIKENIVSVEEFIAK